MIPREILKKIHPIELRTNRIVNETLAAGSFESAAQLGRMKKVSQFQKLGILASLLLLSVRAIADLIPSQLPVDVAMNQEAGRGDWLIIKIRVENGEELPFIVDTGCPGCVLDKSFEPKLGTRLHFIRLWTMFGEQESGLYAAPQIYLGSVPLKTGRDIATYDFKKISAFRRAGIMGILGMDCLVNYCIQLDFIAGKVRFLNSDQVDIVELGEGFPLTLSGKSSNKNISTRSLSIRHAGLLGGSNTNLVIDTGYNNDGAIDDAVIKGHFFTRVAHFLIPFRDLRVGKCVWDAQDYTKLRVGTGWNAVGLRFLARHLVTFDFPKRMVYLKQTSVGPFTGVQVHEMGVRDP
jgi:hypothetical protein